MIQKVNRIGSRAGTRLGLVVALLVSTEFSTLAAYKVVLKDGTVIEAMSKPVSMEKQYIIRTTDNKTHTVPLHQVDLAATEGANQPIQNKSVSSVLTAAAIAPTQGVPGSLSHKDVIGMHNMGFSPEVIAAKIKSSTCRFDTSLSALQELKTSGVPDSVILLMVQSGSAGISQTQAPSDPPSPQVLSKRLGNTPLVLHDGTPLRLRLNRNLSSADAQVGESVDFEVLEDVTVNDSVVIARGAKALATVTEAQPKRRMGRAGKLNVNIDSVRLVNDQQVALRAIKETKGGGNTGKMTGAIVATSILFFPAAPLFLFMSGKDITIPKGTEITAYVSGEIKLSPEQFVATR